MRWQALTGITVRPPSEALFLSLHMPGKGQKIASNSGACMHGPLYAAFVHKAIYDVALCSFPKFLL